MMINSELLRQISIFWSLFHILILFIMLYRPRFSQKKTVLLTIAGMLPLIILNVLGMAILGADGKDSDLYMHNSESDFFLLDFQR